MATWLEIVATLHKESIAETEASDRRREVGFWLASTGKGHRPMVRLAGPPAQPVSVIGAADLEKMGRYLSGPLRGYKAKVSVERRVLGSARTFATATLLLWSE